MTDKLLNDLFSRERLWAGLALPTLSEKQNPQSCVFNDKSPLRYNDQFYNMRSGLLGNQEFRYHSLNHAREGQGQLVDQLPLYRGEYVSSEPVRAPVLEEEEERGERKKVEDQPDIDIGELGGGGVGGGDLDDLMHALNFEKQRVAKLNAMYGGGMRY